MSRPKSLQELATDLMNVRPDTLNSKCDPAIYSGTFVVSVSNPRPTVLDRWCSLVREESGAPFDWHFVGERGVFKTIGEPTQALLRAITRTLPALDWAYRVTKEAAGSEFDIGLHVFWPDEYGGSGKSG